MIATDKRKAIYLLHREGMEARSIARLFPLTLRRETGNGFSHAWAWRSVQDGRLDCETDWRGSVSRFALERGAGA